MKKILSALLILTMLLTMIPLTAISAEGEAPAAWDGTTYDVSWCDPGTDVTIDGKSYKVKGYDEGKTYVIDNPQKLAGLAKLTNSIKSDSFVNCTFEVTADLDLGGKPWTMIAESGNSYSATRFCGSLIGKKTDGSNAVISNLFIENKNSQSNPNYCIGLISLFGGKELSNLTLSNAVVRSTQLDSTSNLAMRVGSFVGSANSAVVSTHFNNLISDAVITVTPVKGANQSWSCAGGICGATWSDNGANAAKPVFENCVFTGTASVENQYGAAAGGIVAISERYVSFKNCIVTGNVSTYTDGTVNVNNVGVGGIIGRLHTAWVTMESCYVSGTIQGFQRVGGFIGTAWSGATADMTNCQFDGIVKDFGGAYRGAFIGDAENTKASKIENCLNSGVASSNMTFDLVALNGGGTPTFTNCYSLYTVAQTSAADAPKIAGSKPTATQLGDAWKDRENSYPILKIAENYANTKYADADFSWFDPANTTEAGKAFELDTSAKLTGYAALMDCMGNAGMIKSLQEKYTFNITAKEWRNELFDASFTDELLKNSVKTEGTVDATKLADTLRTQVSTTIENGNYAIRFIAEIDATTYKNAGFLFTASYVDGKGMRHVSNQQEQKVTCCYSKLNATVAGSNKEVTPNGEGHYLIAFLLTDIPADTDITCAVSAYVEDENGTRTTTNVHTVTYHGNGTMVDINPVLVKAALPAADGQTFNTLVKSNTSAQVIFSDPSKEAFEAYAQKLTASGYTLRDENTLGGNCFQTYTNGVCSV